MKEKKFILKVTCQDRKGIIAALSNRILKMDGFITHLDQFSDPSTGKFFMRIAFNLNGEMQDMSDVFKEFGIDASCYPADHKDKLLILCSKQDHCLLDLLSKWKRGALRADIPAIASNHPDLEEIASWYKIPFYHLPITESTKEEQEGKIRKLIQDFEINYVILARYMQILSPAFCRDYAGKVINIHHSFLPGFKGANPYKQAYDRGVKLIGATAHFVTEDLDEGPIIRQETIRVNHAHSSGDLARYGADIESLVLSSAVKYVLDHQVFINDNKTVVLKY